jgi:carbon storage regulator
VLVLSRKTGETIHIEGQIKVKIVKINGNRVKVGIEAPDNVQILRSELAEWSKLTIDRHSSPDSSIKSNMLAQ